MGCRLKPYVHVQEGGELEITKSKCAYFMHGLFGEKHYLEGFESASKEKTYIARCQMVQTVKTDCEAIQDNKSARAREELGP